MAERYQAAGAGGVSVPDEILEPFLCEQWGIGPLELEAWGTERVMRRLGYEEGKRLAEWGREHPGGGRRGTAGS